MRLPGFSAQTALYESSRHYRTTGLGRVAGAAEPALSINGVVKSPFTLWHHLTKSLFDFIHSDLVALIDPRSCCQDCLSSIHCADESCRRQRLHHCSRKCNAEVIGGCDCPAGRPVCHGACCKPGEVCASDGCSPPNQVCNGRGGCLGTCLPSGCCPPHRIVCKNECCGYGVTACAPDGTCIGCGLEGRPPCDGMKCSGELHPHIDQLSNKLICTAHCGHYHQNACRTTYPVDGGVRSRYRCFKKSKLFATGPADPSNCVCVPNTANDKENDVSDNTGFCISAPSGDIPDPPDCDGPDCTSKHEGDPVPPTPGGK